MVHRILSFMAVAMGLAVLGLTALRGDVTSKSARARDATTLAVQQLASTPTTTGPPRKLLAPPSQLGGEIPTDSLWQNAYNVVHVVTTR